LESPRSATETLEDSDQGEYATPHTDWIVNTIDHGRQRNAVLERIYNTDRAYHWFHACTEDYPVALANHLYLELGGNADLGELAIELRTSGGPNAYWLSLGKTISPDFQQNNIEQQRDEVVKWINQRRITVLYSVFPIKYDRRQISRLIHDACNAFDALPPFTPGSRLLMLFCCMQDSRKQHLWQRILSLNAKPRIIEQCRSLETLDTLDSSEIDEWLTDFKEPQKQRYDKDRLRSGLWDLFAKEGYEVRYEVIRRHLVDEEGLRRAMKTPQT
jgi:hypothetical protein